ncbi:MAG: TetR/AcrR family transcriptional regulator [Sulfuricaulis sp.]|nr:TetR/AcrR family transcriptional regulator [Sulfuricaulis sp.]
MRLAMATDGGSLEGEATRKILLDTGERLFAIRGVVSTSIRSVNDAAGVGAASVHYHFGSKAHLLRAILMRRGDVVVAAIEERARALLAQPEPPSVLDVVRATYDAHCQLIQEEPEGGGYWEQIIGQLNLADDPLIPDLFGQLTKQLIKVLLRCYPQVKPAILRQYWFIASFSLINLLGVYVNRSRDEKGQGAKVTPEFAQGVLEFVATGLEGALRSHIRGLAP